MLCSFGKGTFLLTEQVSGIPPPCRCFSSHLSTKSFFVDKITKAGGSTGRNRKLDGWVCIPMISAFPANAISKLFLSPKSAFFPVWGDVWEKKRDHLREHPK